MIGLVHVFIASLILPFSQEWDQASPLPSCLRSDITWDQSNLLDVVVNTATAEDCQHVCATRDECVSFTWLSNDSVIIPLGCALFSKTGEEVPCDHCVSGPLECLCTLQGECVSQEDNLIEAFTQIPSVRECKLLCEDNSNCTEYTYFEESHVMNHLCLLFSSCETLDMECEDCITGTLDCEICSFDDTTDGQCNLCDSEWVEFNSNCYQLMNNSGGHYNNISVCTAECEQAGGHLTSVHSDEENTFIYSIMRPVKTQAGEQDTWIGAEYISDFNFKWTDGSAWDYTRWDQGEPGAKFESCVFLGFEPSAPWAWTDGVCDYRYYVFDCICKKIKQINY